MEVLTAANQLTILRVLLVPVFALCMLYDLPGWALLTFVVAGMTDLLDGWIARHTGPTTLGAWLDPAADKLLLTTMFVMLTIPGPGVVRLPLWLTVVVISRDVGIILAVAIVNLAVARRTYRPSLLGKATTVAYIATGVVALYSNYMRERIVLVDVGIYASLALTLISTFEYVRRFTRTPPSSS
jgi:cardiolipin synthase